MFEESEVKSCNDCEWHGKANHIHVCTMGISITPALLCGDESCNQWQELDVQRRLKREAEIAAMVEKPKNNWELRAEEIEQNPYHPRILPNYPHPYEVELRNAAMRDRANRHRLVPTLRELQDAQRHLPDPNTYSYPDIQVDIAIGINTQDDFYSHSLQRLSVVFTKTEYYERGHSYFRWSYHGHVLMDDQSNPERENKYLRQREAQARRAYEIWSNIPNPPNPDTQL